VRTTVTINDALLRRAKKLSVERNCTLGEVIDDALRVQLVSRPKGACAAPPRPFKTFKGDGLLSGVDIDSSADLLEAMEGR